MLQFYYTRIKTETTGDSYPQGQNLMDVFTQKKRSEIMSKIRSRDTQIEKFVFRELARQGVYFQKYYKKVIGNPDVALPRKKKAIFIDGDFWHGYKFKTQKQRLPKKYWVNKIKGNIARDKKIDRELKKNGWQVVRIWEHEMEKNSDKTIQKIIKFLKH